ncbi:thioesterase [Micromonospora sp. STR1_7]|uniref:Thioesterase n=1 Tax=Micromonospora parastrephiae TaxID=2806101 RepID=A0ABS1XR38_9ACTN|nr:thioesterase [Micromonospora parastrephiae]MBM0231728.1 thioesterase [Micromonospora parastrephiae]
MRGALVNRKWVVRPRPVPDPDVRVICFPHVGAGASVYNEWAERLPAGAELCAVRYPARENRLDEPPIEKMSTLLGTLENVLAPVTQGRFVLFGHCSGSLVAFELARWLRARGRPAPELLVVSSIEAPAVRLVEQPLHLLPRRDLFARVAGFGGVPPEVLGDPDLMEMFEPVLRADYQVVEAAAYVPSRRSTSRSSSSAACTTVSSVTSPWRPGAGRPPDRSRCTCIRPAILCWTRHPNWLRHCCGTRRRRAAPDVRTIFRETTWQSFSPMRTSDGRPTPGVR